MGLLTLLMESDLCFVSLWHSGCNCVLSQSCPSVLARISFAYFRSWITHPSSPGTRRQGPTT